MTPGYLLAQTLHSNILRFLRCRYLRMTYWSLKKQRVWEGWSVVSTRKGRQMAETAEGRNCARDVV